MNIFVNGLQHSIIHAIMITGFVAMMMVLIEYLNILSRGVWQRDLRGGRFKQYFLASFLGATPGCLGPPIWNWIRVTLVIVSSTALFIVSTVPDHFLEEHLWKHVVLNHVPRVFLWTFGTLLLMHLLLNHLQLEVWL